jgi:cbb3-type cytochrome oxidase subunit 3
MFQFAKRSAILSAVLVFAFFPLISLPARAQAQTSDPVAGNYGLTETRNQGSLKSALTNSAPQSIAGTIVGAVLSLLGVIFFLLIIYGGIRWMLAQGNETEVEAAKQIIIAAVIGLVIVLAAYAITTFIGGYLTGGGYTATQ